MKITKRQAVEKMVREFDAVPYEMVRRSIIGDEFEYFDNFIELTTPSVGGYVTFVGVDGCDNGEIIEVDIENEKVKVLDSYEKEQWADMDTLYEDKDILPMWGTMWIVDNLGYRMNDENFIQKLSEIGFRVYDTEFGYMLGVDGAGYDFYEAHWIPLYDLLELNWHK